MATTITDRLGGTIDEAVQILDSNFTIADQADQTKKLKFEASGITAGQTRSLTAPDASGTIALASDLATVSATATAAAASAAAAVTTAAAANRPRNFAYNTQFAIATRSNNIFGATTIADNGYGFDRWRYLEDAVSGGTIIGRDNVNYDGGTNIAEYSGGFTPVSNNYKFGCFQPLPNRDVKMLRGKTVTFAVDLLVANVSRLTDMRMAVCEWTGTADSVSSDPISSWGTSGNPTLIASWAFLNVPVNLGVTGAFVRYSVTVAVGGAANNLGLLIWNNDQTYNVGDCFRATAVWFGQGTAAPTYEPISEALDCAQCAEFCWKTFPKGTQPTQNAGAGTGEFMWPATAANAAQISPQLQFPVQMFKTPSVTLYNPAAANAQVRNETDGADCASSSAAGISDRAMRIATTGSAGTAIGELLGVHVLAEAEL